MLSARRHLDGKTVLAYYESKTNAPFVCLQCGDLVILKIGKNKVNHFAHNVLVACQFSHGESDAHRSCKREIFDELLKLPDVHNAAMERPFGGVRPDVSAFIKGVPVAIEVQISNLSIKTIMRRTIEYHRKGIYVLWLLQWTPKLNLPRYTPTKWEKWVHAAYFGRVYYWKRGLEVVSYHFESSFKAVPKASWHSKGGMKMTAGGYSKRSKRYRSAVRGQTFNIANDFGPQLREWWERSGVKVPDAKLFMERYKASL